MIDVEEKKKQIVYFLSDNGRTNERRPVTIPEMILEFSGITGSRSKRMRLIPYHLFVKKDSSEGESVIHPSPDPTT